MDLVARLREASSRGKPDGNMMLATSELIDAANQLEALRAALQELVELRGLKHRTPTNAVDWTSNQTEYLRRRPKAWDAAKKALQPFYDDGKD